MTPSDGKNSTAENKSSSTAEYLNNLFPTITGGQKKKLDRFMKIVLSIILTIGFIYLLATFQYGIQLFEI
jgi:hypothetical protein